MVDKQHDGDENTATEHTEKKHVAAVSVQKPIRKYRTLINWMRVTVLLFAGFFLLGQLGMGKPKAKAAIIQSCIKNVPFAERWQNDLKIRGLQDLDGHLVDEYCNCMWAEPLQRLSDKEIHSFAKLTAQQQLDLVGGEVAFVQRDKQCLDTLK